MVDTIMLELGYHQKKILASFPRAFIRETHVFTLYPELMWKQLYNRNSIFDESGKMDNDSKVHFSYKHYVKKPNIEGV
jgi:hypothetical protein